MKQGAIRWIIHRNTADFIKLLSVSIFSYAKYAYHFQIVRVTMTGCQRIWQKKKHSTVKLNAFAESLFYCVLTFQKVISDVFKLNAHQPF